jgi:hypothetical protein
MIRPTLALATLLGLAACAAPAHRHGSAAQEAACAKRADEVFLRQNRAEIYRADQYAASGRDAPFAGAGRLDAPSLSDRYAREQFLENCLAGRTGSAGATPEAPDPFVGANVPKTAPPPPKP